MKASLKNRIQEQLNKLYHNATITNSLRCESDYESDLVQNEFEIRCSFAMDDLQEHWMAQNFGTICQYGRGGRTVAPSHLIGLNGGSRFRILTVEEVLDITRSVDLKELLKNLEDFNNTVRAFCSSEMDEIIKDIRKAHAEDIEKNKGKKRVRKEVIEYV